MKGINLFGKIMVSAAVLLTFGGAYAAPSGRASMMAGATSARMPTMPVVSLNTIGNPAVQTINQPVGNDSGMPHVVPTPTPTPTPTPDDGCLDGGIRNSTYTVQMCMDDILQCVNTGGLQGGINDLFNADVRNSIMGGMRLCQSVVDKCIREVRIDCRNIYTATTDVWLDFNSRVIQPEYYNFVLRKTGLTPNQAENTCLLLDRNTYGESFAAVSDSNAVNSEYNKRVGAYNEAQKGSLSKNNPQGVEINTTGYDGNRGHYARWDATNAECLVRVAAYNKDKLITNSWLFGAVGDNTPAEVWQKAGSSFVCNKDLFDFKSLMNDTRTAAVIAIPGGAILGTAIGAGAGAAAYNKKHNEFMEGGNQCADEIYRRELGTKIAASKQAGVLKSYAYESVSFSDNNGKKEFKGISIFEDNYDFSKLDEEKCNALHRLAEKVELYKHDLEQCRVNFANKTVYKAASNIVKPDSHMYISEQFNIKGNQICVNGSVTCDTANTVNVATDQQEVTEYNNSCLFVPLQISPYMSDNSGVTCSHGDKCLTEAQIQFQIDKLNSLLNNLGPAFKVAKDANKGKEIGKGAAIGAATGAGAGGIATAITALVERSHINCKVGDGLNTVSLGKSHTIDSLKDFYVKWNLKLPDTVAPTAVVTDAASWQQACSQFNSRLMDCPAVQVHLQTSGSSTYQLISAACVQSGTVCVPNSGSMSSYLSE